MSLFLSRLKIKKIIIPAILLSLFATFKIATADTPSEIVPMGLTPQKIYEMAEIRDGKSMSAIRDYLNIKDKNGNTALCLAQKNKDKESFKMLLVFGASTDVECYDNTDTICAIIVGEKLKINGAGWLLGAVAAAGAVYGASELLEDDKKCPSGYSTQYQRVADCGRTGAEGWTWDWNGKDEDGKLCGRCTPKTYDTGCTTLWQSANDCGEHPEGWEFASSGYSGDEVCGICAPKQCVTRDSETIRGENIRYTEIKYCPHRNYMKPTSQEQTGWSGVHGCFICNYECDGTTGFVNEGTCEQNADGHSAYNCTKDTESPCYYRTTPKACPIITGDKTVIGSNVAYTTPANCPFRKYMTVESVTSAGWSGDGECFSCHYKCDETYGFANENTCKNNRVGGEGYICQLDTTTGCYYRSKTPTPDAPTEPEKPCAEGYSTAYQSVANCVLIGGVEDGWNWEENGWSGELKCGKCNPKTCTSGSTDITDTSTCPVVVNKKVIAVQPAGGHYAGAKPCNECVYICDPAQRSFETPEICEANAAGLECIEVNGCHVVQDNCPEGYQTWIQNCDNKTQPSGWDLKTSGNSGSFACGRCNPIPCSSANVTDVSTCGSSGDKGWKLIANGYTGDEECRICEAKTCNTGYVIESECTSDSLAVNTTWLQNEAGGYAGDTACGTCTKTCAVDGTKYFNSKQDCLNKIEGSTNVECVRETGAEDECWSIQDITCSDGYERTRLTDKTECPIYSTVMDLDPSLGDKVTLEVGHDFGDGSRCTLCNFDCTPIEYDKKGENHLTSSRGYCSEAEGWTPTYIQSGCYWCKVKGCARSDQYTNLTIADCIADKGGNNNSWVIVDVQDSYSGGEQCQICGAVACASQGSMIGAGNCAIENRKETGLVNDTEISGIETGSAQCYSCKCEHPEYTADTDCSDGTKTKLSNNSYGVANCYYCSASATPAMMTMMRDVVNNQTLIVEHKEGDYAGEVTINAKATVPVTDEETGEVLGGDAVGSLTVYNSAANADVAVQSNHFNLYNAMAEGAEEGEAINAEGTVRLIMKEGAENTTGYGLKTDTDAYNAYAKNNAQASGLIDITDTEVATNVIYGIQARRNAYNAFANGELARALGSVNIKTKTDIAAYGIHAGKDIYNPNQSVVNVSGTGKGDLYGLYSKAGSVYNSGNVNVHAADGNAYGIYVANGDGQIVDNSGNIIVASDNKTAYGIYVENAGSGMAITNTGAIIATGDENSRGIKVIQNGGNVRIDNQGRILVNGSLNADGTAIDLGGGTLANRGEVEFIGEQNLDALNGTVAVAKGGSYKADKLSGTLAIDKSLVKEGFENVYVAENAVNAENIEGLEISSQSAMFKGGARQNAENNYDAVATRRNFEEFTPNSSMRDYLEENYKQRRLAEFYMDLKDIETEEALRKQILRKTGADTLINMPQENISALRSASLAIADSVLTPTDEENRIISGADSFINETDGRRGASAYDTNAVTAFMYGDKRLDNLNRLGLGLAYTQMSTSYDNGGDHKENFVNLFIPWLHKISEKLRLASILNIGYGYGDYDRGNGDEADINDFIYGMTNKLVYSINLADIAELEPALVVNAIGYYADDMHDKELQVKGGNHLSVEAGIGAYLKKELVNAKYGRLTARLGGMYYHELGAPYNKMRAGFKGGVGEFEINDFANIYSRDRAILSAMLEYEYKRLALYIKYHRLIQRNKAENFDMGIRYNF